MKKQKYLSHIEQINTVLSILEHRLDKVGWLRIATFLLGIVSIIAGFELKNNFYYMIGILLILGFIGLVKHYNKLKTKSNMKQLKKKW